MHNIRITRICLPMSFGVYKMYPLYDENACFTVLTVFL
jgi:hypothetical protein